MRTAKKIQVKKGNIPGVLKAPTVIQTIENVNIIIPP